ncbi:hypothetical protein [Neobacillus sp. LXY-4]|uniref:hypothetical protein n=1 Tax=Neobacillus sp. LXY-4 TaxID=3379826 RepID=UPI003EE03B23
MFNIKYRIAFTNYKEFSSFLEELGYVKNINQDPFSDYEELFYVRNNTEYTLKVSESLFDVNGNLMPASEGWSNDLVQLQEKELESTNVSFIDISDDDLPF